MNLETECPICGAAMTLTVGIDPADPDVGIMSDGFWGVVAEQTCQCQPTDQQLDAMSEDHYHELRRNG